MSAHTPGPWDVVKARGLGTTDHEPAKIVRDRYPFLHIATIEFPVHSMHGDPIETAEPDAVSVANARLIAAAPELLSAALAIEEWWISTLDDRDGVPACMFSLRAAIRKATGEA